eukprot:TRINITY_DN84810_c0_g1_i1.p1 TRINITY_DN84810_c0_g1~~TRINITY_DN84810_c0_g1_i1.p1  ORF type:complete len:213 (-),score=16.19 TRINITY_DN84810_c0_g1_i1:53-655(-)
MAGHRQMLLSVTALLLFAIGTSADVVSTDMPEGACATAAAEGGDALSLLQSASSPAKEIQEHHADLLEIQEMKVNVGCSSTCGCSKSQYCHRSGSCQPKSLCTRSNNLGGCSCRSMPAGCSTGCCTDEKCGGEQVCLPWYKEDDQWIGICCAKFQYNNGGVCETRQTGMECSDNTWTVGNQYIEPNLLCISGNCNNGHCS